MKNGEVETKRPIGVKEYLLSTLSFVIEKGWAFLGLVSHPEIGEKFKDLNEASLAIDAAQSILEILKNLKDPELEKPLKDLEFHLSNLKINFVSLKSQEKSK